MGIYLGSSPVSVYMSGQDGGPKRQEKTVTAGTSAVTVTPDSGSLLSKVTVNPTPSQSKTVTPGASTQTINPDSGKLLSSVTVEGDADLIAGNIKSGVNIFGVAGTLGTPYTGDNPLTIGEEGATIPANTLLKEALQIINGVEPGVTGIDYGEVTGRYDYGYTITVNHNLGVVPTWAAIIPKTVEAFQYTVNMNINGRAWTKNYSGLSYREVNITKTANSISFQIVNDDAAVTEFIWFAIA